MEKPPLRSSALWRIGMAFLQLRIGLGVARDPSDVGNANYVAVQIRLKNTGATGIGIDEIWILADASIKPGLEHNRLLNMFGVSAHFCQHRADSVVLGT
jgi:hypothetical protein